MSCIKWIGNSTDHASELTLLDISPVYLNVIQRFVANRILFSITKQKDSLVDKHNVEFKSMKNIE